MSANAVRAPTVHLPLEPEAEFDAGLNDALRPHLQHGTLIEPIEATDLIGIAHTSQGRT